MTDSQIHLRDAGVKNNLDIDPELFIVHTGQDMSDLGKTRPETLIDHFWEQYFFDLDACSIPGPDNCECSH